MPIGVALFLTAVLILANAFFVSSEFAIVKLRPTRLRQMADGGKRRAKLLLGITNNLNGYLSAFQLGITLCSLAIGWLGESAFAHLIEPHVGWLGSWANITTHSVMPS